MNCKVILWSLRFTVMGVNSDNKSILTLSHVLLLNEMIDVVKMRRSSITVGTLRNIDVTADDNNDPFRDLVPRGRQV